ncbi:unnamed protein product [Caenorhabditis brenneri]
MTIKTKINEVVDQYRILSLIGSGNFGRCYTVEKEGEPDNVMVMKIQKVDGLNEISYKTELEVLRSLPKSHKFSTMISEFAIDTDHKYIVMTYCGISLQTMLMQKENYRFTLENVLRIGIQLFDLVEEFHSLGWLHRDLHWGNVTINTDPDGKLKMALIDFGFCIKNTGFTKAKPKPHCRHSSLSSCVKIAQTCTDPTLYPDIEDYISVVSLMMRCSNVEPFSRRELDMERLQLPFYISPRRRLETQHVWFYDCYKKIETQKGSPYNNDYVKKFVMNVLPDFDPYTNITFTEQQEKIIID